jgi:hypothetical protein
MENKNNHESFVYRWTCKDTQKTYIGKHKGTVDDGYVSSSDDFNLAFKRYPGRFSREIIHWGPDAECLQVESDQIRRSLTENGRKNGFLKSYNSKPEELTKLCDDINRLMAEQQKDSKPEVGNQLRELRKQKKAFIKRFYGKHHF